MRRVMQIAPWNATREVELACRCIICMELKTPVICSPCQIHNGCTAVLCYDCLQRLENKQCPQCSTPIPLVPSKNAPLSSILEAMGAVQCVVGNCETNKEPLQLQIGDLRISIDDRFMSYVHITGLPDRMFIRGRGRVVTVPPGGTSICVPSQKVSNFWSIMGISGLGIVFVTLVLHKACQ